MKKLLPLLCVLFLTLPGCGMFGSSTPPPPPEKPYTPLVDFMVKHQVGESGSVDDPDFGKEIRITMQDSFNSASGEYCKRATIVPKDKEAEVVVICREGDQPWKLAPRIWGG